MSLQIPKEAEAGIRAIESLNEEAIEQLVTALSHGPYSADFNEMATAIAPSIKSIPIVQVRKILEALFRLSFLREMASVSFAPFLDDLMEGIYESSPQFQESQHDFLKERFRRLLGIDALALPAKAMRLQRDGERLYCEARILSDIRPVFESDPKARPRGAVIGHNLRICFFDAGGHREFFVLLESADLKALKAVIDRAHAKDVTLRELLKQTNLTELGD